MANTYRSLIWKTGQSNPSGIGCQVFYINKSQIATWPAFGPEKEAPAESAEVGYNGNIVPVEGQTFHELYTTQGVGNLSSEPTGEDDCQGVTNKGTFSYPDLNEEALDFANKTINSDTVFIVKHFNAGGKAVWAVLGSEHFTSRVAPKATTGSKFGDKKGLELEVTANDFHYLPRYTGTVPLENGTYDCKTNVFTPKASA